MLLGFDPFAAVSSMAAHPAGLAVSDRLAIAYLPNLPARACLQSL
jgi:hypothetical protein